MFASLPHDIQKELEQLAHEYRASLVHTTDLRAGHFDPLNRTDRYGEVCMVVRRPNGRLITMTKTFYPPGAYRLPTGGINHGEHILDAVLRETWEETGLHVAVRRFLAAVAYRVDSSEPPAFYTFAFLLDELGGTLEAMDPGERVEAFREVEPADVLSMAQQLESVDAGYSDEIAGQWRNWGAFRAVIHRVVWEALKGETV